MADPVALQNEIRSLVRERKSLSTTVKRLESQLSKLNGNSPLTASEDGDSGNLLYSKFTGQGSLDSRRRPRVGRARPQEDEALKNFEPEKRPKIEDDSETVHRHKRLMRVGLFGYLQKAKDALVREKDDESVGAANAQVMKHLEKDKLIDTKIEERQKEQSSILAKDIEVRAAHAQDQLNAGKEKLQALEATLAAKQAQLMVRSAHAQRLKLKAHYASMGNFIATSTQPTIFWVPCKFNHHLNSLRDSTRNFVNKKLEIIEATDYSA